MSKLLNQKINAEIIVQANEIYRLSVGTHYPPFAICSLYN